jgi:hypothetical protein
MQLGIERFNDIVIGPALIAQQLVAAPIPGGEH